MHKGPKTIVEDSLSIIAITAWNYQTIWKRINIARRRLNANIMSSSSNDTRLHKICFPEIRYFMTTQKGIKTN